MVTVRRSPLAVGAVLLVLTLYLVPGACGEEPRPADGARPAPGVVEVRFADGTRQKVTLLDDKLDFTTPYGKITVPAADVLALDLAIRIPEKVAREIEKAVTDLGHPEFQVREDATAALVRLGARAYPAVLAATRSDDPEVRGRAERAADKIQQALPAGLLKVRPHDVLTVSDSKFAGRVEAVALRVRTAEGKQSELKLADLLGVRSPAYKARLLAALEVRPDPGTAQMLGGRVGAAYYVRVKGTTDGPLWGIGVYTNDSAIAKAAVHAGVLKDGETGLVKVTIVAPADGYQGETRNGVTSSPYGPWPGAYTVEKADPDD
jgi:hypothetical protein